jgi:hypothetical protein
MQIFEHQNPENDEDWLDVEDEGGVLMFRETNADGMACAELRRDDVVRLVAALEGWLRAPPP